MDENSNNTPLDGTIVKENNQVNIAGGGSNCRG